jgi:hypothetical protein
MPIFGEWNYNIIFYVIMQMQLHFWHIVNGFFGFSSNVILVAYVIVKSPQDELSSCCITFAYEYSKCLTFMMLVNN